MNDTFSKANDLFAHAKEYVDNTIKNSKLSAAEKISGLLAFIIAGALVFSIFLFAILFAGFALAYLAADWTGHVYLGFLLAAVFFFLIGLIIWIAKNKLIQNPLLHVLLAKFFSDENENNNED